MWRLDRPEASKQKDEPGPQVEMQDPAMGPGIRPFRISEGQTSDVHSVKKPNITMQMHGKGCRITHDLYMYKFRPFEGIVIEMV